MISLQSYAQVKISGMVLDARRKPVAGASISIRDSYDGATSDSSGKFSFLTTEKGARNLTVSSIGYTTLEKPIELADQPIILELLMREEISEMKAVTISAGSFEAGDKKKGSVLTPLDIVTTASANADVTGALKSLPGAQQVGESEGLFVRGGTAAETRTFIDGTLVNNFFFSSVPNIAQRGRFSPFIFKGTVFSTGGYSALYGQALSSALILETIDMPEETSASLGATIVGLSGGYQHLAKDKRSSFGINYNYTDLRLAFSLISQRQEYEQVPLFHSADANFRIRTSKSGILKYYGSFSYNRLRFYTPSIDTLGYLDGFAIRNSNIYHNLSWRESLGGGWKLQAGISHTDNRDDVRSGTYDEDKTPVLIKGLEFRNFSSVQQGSYLNGRVVLERKFTGLNAIRFGGEYNRSADRTDYTAYDNQVYSGRIVENLKAIFAETDLYITNGLAAKAGGRFEHSSYLQKANFAPRLSLAYRTGKYGQASLAYGIFHQNPERKYLPGAGGLTFSKATHYIAQYLRTGEGITMRAELFYKKYDGLVKTAGPTGMESAVSNDGFGDAKGFELFWRDKKSVKDLDYWISYSFLDTKRDFLNFPFAVQPNFAARHTASVVAKKFVGKLKSNFNISYNYASGRPYYFIRANNQTGKTEFLDRGNTIPYHNVSLSVNYLPNIGSKDAKLFGVYVFSVSNVFNSDQVFGYQYSFSGHRKEAIVPPARVFVFVGAFLSFGVDRTGDVINSNL